MARGGINKVLVKEARDAVLAKGQHPSIDTIRIALGNTGSKTTIHRYLKELEEEESSRLDDESLLSDTLKEMVARLASRLHEEAHDIIKSMEAKHAAEVNSWEGKYQELDKNNLELREQLEVVKQQLKEADEKHDVLGEKYAVELGKNERLEQQVSGLNVFLKEKESHIASLEEKHQHSRDALEHYRSSVKEQRDQDIRRHEHQVQQLQVEIRQLNQTLSIKQAEITQLNKDNSRLVTELSSTQRLLNSATIDHENSKNQLQSALQRTSSLEAKLEQQEETLNTQSDQVALTESELQASEQRNKEMSIEIGKLESELAIKNQFFDKINIQGSPEEQVDSTAQP